MTTEPAVTLLPLLSRGGIKSSSRSRADSAVATADPDVTAVSLLSAVDTCDPTGFRHVKTSADSRAAVVHARHQHGVVDVLQTDAQPSPVASGE